MRPRSAPVSDAVDEPRQVARFPKFAAAMDAARVANAPQFDLYDAASPVASPPEDEGASWRAPGRRVVRWVGIGSCVLLFGLLTVTMLTQPLGGAIEQLIGPGLALQDEPAAAAVPPDRTPATLEPAEGLDEPPPTPALPVLARTEVEASAPWSPKVTVLDAGERPPLRTLPVPSFKPPSAP